METLQRVGRSMKQARTVPASALVTVILSGGAGKADQLFINTAGIGVIEHDQNISPQSGRTGDAVILSGDIGRHGWRSCAAGGACLEVILRCDCADV